MTPRLAEPRQQVGRKPAAVVGDRDQHVVAVSSQIEGNFAGHAQRLHRVVDQVGQDAFELDALELGEEPIRIGVQLCLNLPCR